MSNRSGRLLYRHNVTINGAQRPLAAAVLEREGALRIARVLRSGHPAKVRLRLAGRYLPSVPARNVVAEIRGRETPEELVILGAHLDSWELGRVALDAHCDSFCTPARKQAPGARWEMCATIALASMT